jgi:hypothetical protein
LDGTFILFKDNKKIGVPMDRTDWHFTCDNLEELSEEYKTIYQRSVPEKEIQRDLGLGCNRNYSLYIVLKFGGLKPGFYLRFKTYGPQYGNNSYFVEKDRKDVQLTQTDWHRIKRFLFEHIKDEPIRE